MPGWDCRRCRVRFSPGGPEFAKVCRARRCNYLITTPYNRLTIRVAIALAVTGRIEDE